MPSPRGFFSSGLPAQPIRPFTTKTFCARAALNRGLSRILSLSLLESEHSSFSFPAQSAHFGLCVVHGEGEHPNGDAKASPCDGADREPPYYPAFHEFESVNPLPPAPSLAAAHLVLVRSCRVS